MGCFAGGLVCGHISNKSRTLYVLLLGFLLMMMGFQNLRVTPRPLWYLLTLFFIYVPPAWAASWLVGKRHERANEKIRAANEELRAAAKRKAAKKK
jgi:predicted MFS family arabinose efflux permease